LFGTTGPHEVRQTDRAVRAQHICERDLKNV
jgi:hypothetical protein